jgi:hypothetical protein
MKPSMINALGVRLAKSTVPTPEDFDLLNRLQNEYMRPLEQTGAILREKLNLAEHGSYRGVALTASNRLKTTGPIIDKLRRKTRLSAMQDIVGYRIVGDLTLRQQDELVAELRKCFDDARVVDRRTNLCTGTARFTSSRRSTAFPSRFRCAPARRTGGRRSWNGTRTSTAATFATVSCRRI